MSPSATGLWDWAVKTYARPEAEALCLSLQDEHGQCVSYLLWAAWAQGRGRAIDEDALAAAADLARHWETAVLRPLRSIRRALKDPGEGVPIAAQKSLRLRIMTEELAAERLLLEALEAHTPAGAGAAGDLDQALSAAVAAWGGNPPSALIEALGRAFSIA